MARCSQGLDETIPVMLSSGICISGDGGYYYPEEETGRDYSIDPIISDIDFTRTLSDLEQEVFDFLIEKQEIVENPSFSKKKRKLAVEYLNSKLVSLEQEYGLEYAYFFLKILQNKIGHRPALCKVVIDVFDDYEEFRKEQALPYYRRKDVGKFGKLDSSY
jgi:hypothetical protein